MRIDPIDLQTTNPLIKDYRQARERVQDKFHYHPFHSTVFADRKKDLKEQSFQRDELVRVLHEINGEWDAPRSTVENIDRLADTKSTVVIGGQQAGLLTGPLYSVHKLISIIYLSRKAEKEEGTPVIPVFWIAGEDHDFDEINHVFLPEDNRMQKYQVKHTPVKKSSVTDIPMDKPAVEEWLGQVFSQLEESVYTKDLENQIYQVISQSNSYVDFFARLIFHLFREEGVVLVDSHHSSFRKLESQHFKAMIHNQQQITQGVYAAWQQNMQQGYPVSLDCNLADVHLFYHHDGERVLLMKGEDGKYYGKQNEVVLTKEQLLDLAEEHPESLSNNVVTRPLMQELMFPTLAFIGGPGEINYWSVLKPAFEAMEVKMPPVFPRLSFSLIDRKTAKYLDRFHLRAGDVIEKGVSHEKTAWLTSQSYPPLEAITEQVKNGIERIHQPLREKAAEIRDDVSQLADKNLAYLFKDIEFLEQRMTKALEEKHASELNKFDYLELVLHPGEGLQERMWGILPWMNQYGWEIFQEILEHDMRFEEAHHCIYL
ncbi:putative cysteine ligase BshC [Thalassobacillus devorans]|uniref:Putative cysteine ligase BshC n=1 Tax=Thalassobacillus devorans TaxID=279813 RepID=A0ABQ1NM53_9BACI|nr:bacillithiol biosynthesis cysteine-adding enzyme BshC [Thalassobacillus devorans]NIK27804.1 bacillithiol biosynthesis cysteine-adding enzyme BshC [Thalassobacillus devorans]GGC80573.1 putative cysteine ligase BshC [Thalassobacillus devorans]